MVRELKALIEDISSINTSVDMDDIQMVSELNGDIVNRILSVRDFLLDLNIEVEHPSVTAYNESKEYPELNILGLSDKTINECKAIYNARVSKTAKMSFDTVMKCCVFVTNYVIEHGIVLNDGTHAIARLMVNKPMRDYLIDIDSTQYCATNIHDFLTNKNFAAIATKFFKCDGNGKRILSMHDTTIDPATPF